MARIRNRRRFISTVGKSAFGASAIALAGCAGTEDSENNSGDSDIQLRSHWSTEDSLAFQMAQGISAVFDSEVDDISFEAFPSEGAEASMQLLDRGETDMAYTTLNTAWRIQEGIEPYDEQPFENDIYQLWHFYAVEDAFLAFPNEHETVDQLEGDRIYATFQGSAIRKNIMGQLEYIMDIETTEFPDFPLSEMASALKDGRADSVVYKTINGGELIPEYSKEVLRQNENARVIQWPEEIEQHVAEDPLLNGTYYSHEEVGEPEHYHVPDEPAWFSQTLYNTFCTDRLNDDTVYRFMEAFYENSDDFEEYHTLMSQWSELDFLTDNLHDEIPIHPGAVDFYEDNGINL